MKIYVIENLGNKEVTNTFIKGAREANFIERLEWIYKMRIMFPIYKFLGMVNRKGEKQ